MNRCWTTTNPGCADKSTVECPGETFCCPVGKTCARDAAGNAECLDSSRVTFTPPNTIANINTNTNDNGGRNSNTINGATKTSTTTPSPSSGNNNNPLDNINPFKKNAALPQVAVTSGLMVTVAFLSAFLVSPLTFSH